MSTITLTSREFNQDTGKAKKAALDGPVVITDRGRPSHVLLSYEEYERIQPKREMTLAESFYWPGAEDIDLPLPDRTLDVPREIDFD